MLWWRSIETIFTKYHDEGTWAQGLSHSKKSWGTSPLNISITSSSLDPLQAHFFLYSFNKSCWGSSFAHNCGICEVLVPGCSDMMYFLRKSQKRARCLSLSWSKWKTMSSFSAKKEIGVFTFLQIAFDFTWILGCGALRVGNVGVVDPVLLA